MKVHVKNNSMLNWLLGLCFMLISLTATKAQVIDCNYEINYTLSGFDIVSEITPLGSSATPDYTDWFIDGGIGYLGSGSPFTYTFPGPGIYEYCVEYEVAGEDCLGFVCEQIVVGNISCGFQATYTEINDSLFVLEAVSPPTNYSPDEVQWTISGPGGAWTGTGNPFTIVLPVSGDYTICALGTIFDDNGNVICEHTSCITVTLTIPPPAPLCDFEIGALMATEFIWGFEPILGPNASSLDEVDWQITNVVSGSSVSFDNIPILTYEFPEAGTYEICAEGLVFDNPSDANIVCEYGTCINLTINTINCDFAISNIVINDSIGLFETQLIDPVSPPLNVVEWIITNTTENYSWTEVGDPIEITFPESGVYEVCAVGSVIDPVTGNELCISDNCISYTVVLPNDCNYEIQYTLFDEVIVSELVPLGNSSSPNIVGWFIDGGIGYIGSGSPFTYTFPSPGTYEYCVEYEDSGCLGVICEQVVVQPGSCYVELDYTEVNDSLYVFELGAASFPTPFDAFQWEVQDLNSSMYISGLGEPFTVSFPYPSDWQVCVLGSVLDPITGNVTCETTSCDTLTLTWGTVCEAAFDFEFDTDNTLNFYNTSTGVFDNQAWDFGDGSTSTSVNPTHTFSAAGTYNVCLGIWSNDGNCSDNYCQLVDVEFVDSTCYQTDCVFPGDANYDQIANNFDLLPIGLYFGVNGPARPNASYNWEGQSCPDWAISQATGANLKHVDCDGNGQLGFSDLLPIIVNYNREHNGIEERSNVGAPVYIQFDTDTLVVDPSSGSITLQGNIMVGTEMSPATDVYGLAFSLAYPADFIEEGSVDIMFDDVSWFGNAPDLLLLDIDLYDLGQIDAGMSRTDGQSVSGYGKVGTIEFTITDNIIGRSADEVPVNLEVLNIRMINDQGTELEAEGQIGSILLVSTTGVNNPALDKAVSVYPNPTNGILHVECKDLSVNEIVVYNAIGQELSNVKTPQNKSSLDLSNFSKGVYFVKINTSEGNVTKRIIID